MIKNILTIAGSDSGGGAGIQADLKTIAALGEYGLSVITAVTAQNTKEVAGVHPIPPDIIAAQLKAVFEDIRIDAVKIGMLACPQSITEIAAALQRYKPQHIVLDPVMISTSGDRLCSDETIAALKEYLVPLATIITPNLPEARVLLGPPYDGDVNGFAAALMEELDVKSVLLKGGNADGAEAVDIFIDGAATTALSQPRIETKNTHGTGCTLASALAVYLAQGLAPLEAARAAKAYVTGALQHAHELDVGHGAGPLNHFYKRGAGDE